MHILSDMLGKMVYHSEKPIQHLLDLQWIRQEQGLFSENVHQTRYNSNIFHQTEDISRSRSGAINSPDYPGETQGNCRGS